MFVNPLEILENGKEIKANMNETIRPYFLYFRGWNLSMDVLFWQGNRRLLFVKQSRHQQGTPYAVSFIAFVDRTISATVRFLYVAKMRSPNWNLTFEIYLCTGRVGFLGFCRWPLFPKEILVFANCSYWLSLHFPGCWNKRSQYFSVCIGK